MNLVVIAIVLVLLAAVAVELIRTSPAATGSAVSDEGPAPPALPPGRVVYSDADGSGQILVARRYPLCGKPDYVVLTPQGRRIPVDIKSSRPARGQRPHHADELQLGVYMLILADLYPRDPAPTHGVLHYATARFDVPNTAELRAEVLALLAEMREIDASASPHHANLPSAAPTPTLCRRCAYRTLCDAAL